MILIFLVIVGMVALAWAERLPISYEDEDGVPVTGAMIWAATWGSRPPDTLQIATEEGAGIYYFTIGPDTLPAGYYDVWREGILDSAWAGFYIGYGNMPPLNSLDSTYYKDGGTRLDQDIQSSYGNISDDISTILDISASTKTTSTVDRDLASIYGVNYTDEGSARVSALALRTDQGSTNDSTGSPAGLSWAVLGYDREALGMFNKWSAMGPTGIYGRMRCTYSGIGHYIDIRQGNNSGFGSAGEICGVKAHVGIDSLGTWWDPPGDEAGLFVGTLEAQRLGEGWGLFADVEGDTSFNWAFGTHVRVQGKAGGYGTPLEATGHYSVVNGWELSKGFKTFTYGYGPGTTTKGVEAWVGMADTSLGLGGTHHGAWLHVMHREAPQRQAHKRAYGIETLAGADTAWGGYFSAWSDEDQASNKAVGVFARGQNGVKNYGLRAYAEGSSDGYFSITNKGVEAWATGGNYNTGGYFRATYPDAGATNVGVYAWADSGGTDNWAGQFKGRVGIDSLVIPLDNDAWLPPALAGDVMARIEADADDEVGIYLSTGGGDDNKALWIEGGFPAEDDYGIFMTGTAYPITQISGGGTGHNTLSSETRLGEPYHNSTPLRIATTHGNVATIPSGEDTVWVVSNALNGESSSTAMVQITALERNPDGKDQWVDDIGRQIGVNYGFMIHADSTQAADQKFYWRIWYLGPP
jgi:hypothetical protein